MYRTDYCGAIREGHIGRSVTVTGWVQRQRDLGAIIFIDLRDREGLVQCVFDESVPKAAFDAAFGIRSESVLRITGTVRARSNPNPNIPTGGVELLASELEVLSRALTPPFEVDDDTKTAELTRLEYRYIDLRRPKLQGFLRLRHQAALSIRRFYDENGFLEIETPMLTSSTPEGARDYLVPSRLHPGEFYALPQSPQQYKQLLMVSGFDRYFQIARCFRDEDLRADRQPDFTQVDVEMSFVDMEDIFEVNERMLARLFKDVLNVELPLPFPRLPYREAVERFGTDKPDLRFGFELRNVIDTEYGTYFRENGYEYAGAITVPDSFTRKELDKLNEFVKGLGAGGLRSYKADGQLTLVIGDKKPSLAKSALGALRVEAAKKLNILDPKVFKPLWITEFPLFTYSEEEGRFVAEHHPFTAPMDEDIPLLEAGRLGESRGKCYDMVLNGYELCSGSIRIHDAEVQAKMFELLRLSPEDTEKRFGHLLRAFKYGVPPHGGVGFGLDRIIMIMCGTDNIRDVIAFPKTQNAVDMMMRAPSAVDPKQLDELRVAVKP
ncbi:aspartate--tRNA ligase [Clostridia bacterium]|nr:aspartate--tRNA ligase [Clostridia bacterium]GHV31583.1 aspartate--tRNA ligase [Clostridia bacterium]